MNLYSDNIQEQEPTNNDSNAIHDHFSDSPLYDTLKDAIAEQLFEINGQISTVTQFIVSLRKFENQNNVNTEYVERIDKKSIDIIHKIRKLLDTMNQSVNEMNTIDDNELNKSKLMSREKLNKDIKLSIQEFQNIQIEYTKIMKSINLKAQEQLNQNVAALRQEEETVKEGQQKLDFDMAKDNTKDNIFDADHRSKNNQMIIEMDPINNEEFSYQQNLIRERDAEIQNIEQGINELHEIFRDLGTVIQQQGILVDNIEANIYSAVDNTQKGSKELHKAMLSQKKQGKFCLYLLVFLSLLLLFMILVILS